MMRSLIKQISMSVDTHKGIRVLIALIIAFGCISKVQGQTVVVNSLSAPDDEDGTIYVNDVFLNYAAQGFTMGASDIALSAITLSLRSEVDGNNSTANISIRDNPDNTLGTLIEDLGNLSTSISTYTELTINSNTNPVLSANTNYWVHITYISGESMYCGSSMTATNTGVAGTIPSNSLYYGPALASNYFMDMKIEGNFSPTFTSTPVTSVDDDAAYSYTVTASDADGDNITLSATEKPDWLTLNYLPTVSTFAGSGSLSTTDGNGTSASFIQPVGLVVDASDNIYVSTFGARIRKITPAGDVSTLAGSGTYGADNGTGTAASFNNPTAMAIDASGNLFVADFGNHLIRKITSAGEVSTFAGTAGVRGSTDALGTSATFSGPVGLAMDAFGNLFVAEIVNNLIRKITPAGEVSTFAGSGSSVPVDGTGTAAAFHGPNAIDIDGSGNLYVTEQNSNLIRKITPAGVVTTIAGTGSRGASDGVGTSASFNIPFDVLIDNSDNLLISDYDNHTIRKITPSGVVSTIAGTVLSVGSVNGVGTAASFYGPIGLAMNSAGEVYVADQGNNLIRKMGFNTYQLSGSPTGQAGDHSITLEASDGNGGVTEQSFTLTVNDVTAPSGYSVAIDQAYVNASNESAISFTISGGEIGTTYNYSFTDALASSPVTGSGTVSASNQQVTGIDLSLLGEGIITLGLTLTDGASNAGSSVTDTKNKDITEPSFGDDSPSASNITGGSFDLTMDITKTGKVYYVLVADGATAPSYLEVRAGNASGGGTPISSGNASTTIASSGAHTHTFNITGLSESTAYDVYGLPEDASENFPDEVAKIDVTTADVTDPVFTSTTSVNYIENGTIAAYTVTATDLNTLTYSLGTGNDETLFDIVSGTGVITFNNAPDFENPTDGDANNAYVINVISNDGTNTVNQDVTITVTDVDEIDPVFTSTASVNFAENGTGTVYTVTATDANTLIYSLGTENDEALFDIVGSTGVVTFKDVPDFENPTDGDAGNTYIVNVIVSDGLNAVNQDVTITVIDVDEIDPVFTSTASADFAENGTGTAYTVVATDANTLIYSLGTENDESLFDIIGGTGVVTFKDAPDFENPTDGDAGNTYIVNVIASDGLNAVNQDVTISVTDVDEIDPVFTSTASADFAENGTGTAYTVTATDASSLIYSLGTENDESLFDIIGGTGVVTFKNAPDFENPTDEDANNTYIVNVIANDGINSVNKEVIITVTDVDDSDPVFTSATTTSFMENATGIAYTVTATDVNTLAYSLGSGNDESLFDIVSTSGVVTFKTTPDFENPSDADNNNIYVITVVASDGVNTVNQEVTITVTDVDDTNPVFTSLTIADFAENGIGTVYTAVATSTNTLVYSLGAGNDEALFDIVSNTGVVTFISAPDFENPLDIDGNNTYVISVVASDGTNTMNQTVTITVIDVTNVEQSITFNALAERSVDSGSFDLIASSSSGLSVTYTSSDESVVTINGNTVTIVGGGTTVITALQEGDSDFGAATSIQQTLVVNKLDQTITFDSIDDQIFENNSLKLNATASSALGVTFSIVSGPATIEGDELTFTNAGMVTVSASQAGNEAYLAANSVEQSFEISAITGIEDEFRSLISFYPNPVISRINIDLGNEKLVRVDIRDLTGKLVITELNPIDGVDVNHLHAGNYLIQLITVNRTITQHLMKR